MKKLRVAVLMGGPSPERAISIATGGQIVTTLDPGRYSILPVEITPEGKWLPRPDLVPLESGRPGGTAQGSATLAEGARGEGAAASLVPTTYDRFMEHEKVDVAFIAMHGPYGEDGTMQGLLELLGIPYTGSGVLASALAMDKLRSRQIFEWHRIPVPAYVPVTVEAWRDPARVQWQVAGELGYPCAVKPNAVGSSIGVSLVRDAAHLEAAVEQAFAYGPVVLVEEYVAGTEITCGIVDDPATSRPVPLPLIEIVPRGEFYDYEAKYAAGGSEHVIPARVSAAVAERAQALAVRACEALGCEGMGRVDMIAREADIVVLEINTIPGMTATSLLPEAARAAGIAFPELLDRILQSALRKQGIASRRSQ